MSCVVSILSRINSTTCTADWIDWIESQLPHVYVVMMAMEFVFSSQRPRGHFLLEEQKEEKNSAEKKNCNKASRKQMLNLTYIARVSDGLALAASMEDTDTERELEDFKKQQKKILQQLSSFQVPPERLTIESGPYNFQ